MDCRPMFARPNSCEDARSAAPLWGDSGVAAPLWKSVFAVWAKGGLSPCLTWRVTHRVTGTGEGGVWGLTAMD